VADQVPQPATVFTQLRLLQLLRALDLAGTCPVSLSALHSFVYFANVLSPLWNLVPYENEVLKSARGPYYPAIQRQIDTLIASGSISVESFQYTESQNGRAWLEAQISFPKSKALEVDELVAAYPDDQSVFPFLCELALAFAEIRPDRQDDAALEDATYSDPKYSVDRVIDLSNHRAINKKNATIRVTESFQEYVGDDNNLTRAQKLLLYMRLMKKRANG
jgi:hypothetical protein